MAEWRNGRKVKEAEGAKEEKEAEEAEYRRMMQILLFLA